MKLENPIHLGDGAYATWTGHDVVLTANHHQPSQATDVVYLNRSAIHVLYMWCKDLINEDEEKDN